MIKESKALLSRLKKDNIFKSIIEKITLKKILDEHEKEYILKLAIIFYEWFNYEQNNYYFEFSYFLILNYSINCNDYVPLYDFSLSAGFYPISKLIQERSLVNNNIFDAFYNIGVNRYANKDRIETNEQHNIIRNLLNSESKNRSLVAPTSYGKSEFILDDIEKLNLPKVGIIVPKKALIWETYRRVKSIAKKMKYKVMMHDTEYTGFDRFIAIFTQERALRLLQENNVYFDILYIDEAHNLFEANERNILLSRLIRLNTKFNNNQKTVYLSPLINDSTNLLFDKNQAISEQKISFNVKEPRLIYFTRNEQEYIYNRFIDEMIYSKDCNISWRDYIQENTVNKSLLFAYKPKAVQDIALEFSSNIPFVHSNEIDTICEILVKYIDKDYYLVELLKKGIIFVHGKVPDSIRDYLLSKFKTGKDIKYLVSNTSVLEGVNFPIDSIFIMNTYSLNKNDLLNLIGRVNRLNDIFLRDKDITKLVCPVYFIESSQFEGNSSIKNKIKQLRSTEIVDDVQNPILPNSKVKNERIVNRENSFLNEYNDDNLRMILIKNGLDSYYKDFEKTLDQIHMNIKFFNETIKVEHIDNSNLFTVVQIIFMYCFEYVDFKKEEIARLINKEARDFYNIYISKIYFKDMKTKIRYFMSYFNYYELNNAPFYIGEGFGEISKKTALYPESSRLTYIDIRSKSYKEKVNIAIIKSKIEDDLISYTIANFVKSLFDLNIIGEDTYNNFLYDTVSTQKIDLLKSGLSHQVINFIEENKLLQDISFHDYGFQVTDKFKQIILEQDDFIKFEISKTIDF
jgi:hypothetical protein